MIKRQKVLALIPARGGSKGLKDKNIRELCGKPLIAHTIAAALASAYVDTVVVSTDSPQIRDVAVKHGALVPFLRPARLATDSAKTIGAVLHALEHFESIGERYDILVLLQPTEPLRNQSDIDGALDSFMNKRGKSLASISEAEKHALLMRTIGKNGKIVHVLGKRSDKRRQDMKKHYKVDGAIYINKIRDINKRTSFNDSEIGYIIPRERAVDIDDETDFIIAEAILKSGRAEVL